MKNKKRLILGIALLIVGIISLQIFSEDGYDFVSGIIVGIGIGLTFTGLIK